MAGPPPRAGGWIMPDTLSALHAALAAFLLLNILVGLVRVARGPEPVDRMMAAQLLSTLGIATVLVFGEARRVEALLDVALVLAVLAAVMAVTFARRYHGLPDDAPPDAEEEEEETRDEP